MTATDPIARSLAALILLCGFGLLARRRLAQQITLLRVQAFALAAAALDAAYRQSAAQLLLAALIVLALHAGLLPAMLCRVAQQLPRPTAKAADAPVALALPLGLFLTMLALSLAPLALAAPLAVALLGLLATTLRRDALAQTIGLFAAANGVMLAAIGLPGLPIIAVFPIVTLALPAAVLVGVSRLRPPVELARLEIVKLETGS